MAEKLMTREELLADLDVQIKQTQLEMMRAQLQDAQESIQKRKLTREQIEQVQRDRAIQLADEAEQRRLKFISCPHKKGGTDYAGWKKGSNEKYTVIRFQFPNGDYMCECSRCSNVVIPPVEPIRVPEWGELPKLLKRYGHQTPAAAGFFLASQRKEFSDARKLYLKGMDIYQDWMEYPTDNVASTSGQIKQHAGKLDFVRLYRLGLHEVYSIPIFSAQRWEKPKRRSRKEEEEEEDDAA